MTTKTAALPGGKAAVVIMFVAMLAVAMLLSGVLPFATGFERQFVAALIVVGAVYAVRFRPRR